jgi:hypothetical protein
MQVRENAFDRLRSGVATVAEVEDEPRVADGVPAEASWGRVILA